MSTAPKAAIGQPVGLLLADALYSVFNALQHSVNGLLAELNLTESLADALWQLDPASGPLSRRMLAERLHCDPSNVTFLVDRLEERGLAQRVENPHDRRVKGVSLTAAGIVTRDRLLSAAADSPLFAGLSPDEQQQLIDLLSQCLQTAADAPAARRATTAASP